MDTLPLVNNAPQEWTMNNTHLMVNNVALGASVQNLFMLSVIFHPSGALQKKLSLCISMKVVDIFTLEVLALVPSHFDIYKLRYAQNNSTYVSVVRATINFNFKPNFLNDSH